LISLVSGLELPVYLAGGIDQEELPLLCEAPLAGLIIGAAIAEASSPAQSARQMRRIIDQRDKSQVRRS
jgi:3-keto-L-gulonate-6-phosphate decarboxylase